MTVQDRFVRYLEAQGATFVETKSKRYKVYHRYVDGGDKYYHLGKAGACRTSKDGVITHSCSSERTRTAMVAWEREQGLLKGGVVQ